MTLARMSSIPHFTQMSINQVVRFLGDDPTQNYSIKATEKVDGSNMSICVIDNKLFIKSKKGEPIRNPKDFIQLASKFEADIMLDFARLLKVLLKQEKKIVKLFKTNNIEQLFCEIVPNAKPNIIKYDAKIIGRGLLYIFDNINSGTFHKLQQIISPEWHVYKPIDICEEVVSLNYFKDLIIFANQYKTILSSRKRDSKTIQDKREAGMKLREMLEKVAKDKLQLIKNVKSILGASEIEGIVFENVSTGFKTKLVDLDNFGKRRADEWAGSTIIKDSRIELFNTLHNKVFNNADILIINEKQNQKIVENVKHGSACSGTYLVDLDWICNIIFEDALIESGKTITQIICDANIVVEEYFEKLLRIEVDGEPSKAVLRAEIKNISELSCKLKNRHSPIYLVEYMLGFKRCNELVNKFGKS
jgi:hypothetical protein